MMIKMTKRINVENRALAIFVKNPELGKAKTRIAKDSSDEKAFDIYNTLLSITRNLIKEVDTNKYIFYSKFIDTEDQWVSPTFNKKLQGGNNLGDKMSNGFKVLFTEKYNKVLLIGSDCPYITEEILLEAYNALNKKDFVIGPTFDGGYYLIGMKQYRPLVFSDIEWSTEAVLNTTIERIMTMNCSYELLPRLKAIDQITDWEESKSKFNKIITRHSISYYLIHRMSFIAICFVA